MQARLGDHFLDLTQGVDHAELALIDHEQHGTQQGQHHQQAGDNKSDSVHKNLLACFAFA
ncbi:hypothetical protein D3C80_1813890 [compost metagenome]